jgi:hypothetical protein
MPDENRMIPVADSAHRSAADAPNSAPAPGKTKGLVLVVDDEPYINLLITSILKLHGCDVLSATNGAHALTVLAEHPQIAAIVTDLHMPTMDGGPGYPESGAARGGRDGPGRRVRQTPFDGTRCPRPADQTIFAPAALEGGGSSAGSAGRPLSRGGTGPTSTDSGQVPGSRNSLRIIPAVCRRPPQ